MEEKFQEIQSAYEVVTKSPELIAPVPRDHPAYVYMRDGDGWVCE